MHEVFTKQAEARQYVDSIQDPTEQLLTNIAWNRAIGEWVTHPNREVLLGQPVDLLAFVVAVHAFFRDRATLEGVLAGKIRSLDDLDPFRGPGDPAWRETPLVHVYPLEHTYRTEEGYLESKFIGVYSSWERARAAIEQLVARLGFRDRPEGFELRRYVVGEDHWADGYTSDGPAHEVERVDSPLHGRPETLMTHIHVLWHWYETERGDDVVKFIGVYASEEDGRSAVERLKEKPGFRERPESFDLQRYPLDKTHWEEGYISVQEAPRDVPERHG